MTPFIHCSSSLCQATKTANGPGLGPSRKFCECTCDDCVQAYEPEPSILVAVPKSAQTFKDPKPMRRFNARRRRLALAEDFGDLAVFVRTLPCLVIGCRRGPVDAAHVRSRGAGHHAWIEIDGKRFGNIVPLCRQHHDRQGSLGTATFEATYRLGAWLANFHRVDTLAEAARVIGDAQGGAP